MRSQRSRPALVSRKGDELSLSGPAFLELFRSVLNKGVPFRFKAKGTSMYPFIRDGDIVTVSPLSDALPRLGDVVALAHPKTGKLIIHRMIGKKGGSLIIMGDSLPKSDGIFPKASVLGCVTKVDRKGKGVYLGLGFERIFIALLTRSGCFYPLLLLLSRLNRPTIKRESY